MSDAKRNLYLRTIDEAELAARPATERVSTPLIDRDSGGTACMISYIRTPAQGGSPRGMHVHDVDQHFYVLSGTMSIEVDGERFQAGPGSLVYFPAGVPHRNWNEGEVPTVHLSINAPLPEPGQPLGRPVS